MTMVKDSKAVYTFTAVDFLCLPPMATVRMSRRRFTENVLRPKSLFCLLNQTISEKNVESTFTRCDPYYAIYPKFSSWCKYEENKRFIHSSYLRKCNFQRQLTGQLRSSNDMSARTQPAPKLPDGPYDKLSGMNDLTHSCYPQLTEFFSLSKLLLLP